MRPVRPEVSTIELDVTEAPVIYRVNALDADGELVDVLEELTSSEAAHAVANEVATSSNLPLLIRDDH